MIQHIKLMYINPNPWQPRLHEDAEKVVVLRDSILANFDVLPKVNMGLYQIPMARVVDTDGVVLTGTNAYELASYIDAGHAVVQLAFGHRRNAAFRLLAGGSMGNPPDERFNVMPLELVSLSDLEMAKLGAGENIEREQLSWYEKAVAMNRFIDHFTATQGEAAAIYGLKDKSSVSQYVRALDAIKHFNHPDLMYWSETGKLPLLHVLNLVPLLRDKPLEARQWLAKNQLVDEETGDVVSATWIKREVELFLPRQTQPAIPSEEGAQHWYDFFMQQRYEHDGEYVFMQMGRNGTIWVSVGEDAEKIAQRIQAPIGMLKAHHKSIPAIAIWMGSPISDARRDAMEALIGPFDGYLEPSADLGAQVTANLKTVNELRAVEPEPQAPPAPVEPEQPQMSRTTGAPIPGIPKDMRFANLPKSTPPAAPAKPAPTPAAPPAPLSAAPAAPQLSDEEREAAAAEQMRRLFPGGNGTMIQGPWNPPAAPEPAAKPEIVVDLRHRLEDVASLLNTAANILSELVETASEADLPLMLHLDKSTRASLHPFAKVINGLIAEGALEDLQDSLTESENPEKTVRDFMMSLSRATVQQEVQAINEQ